MLALSAQASPRALKHVASNAGLLRSRVAPTTRPQLALREIPSDLRGHNIDRPAATLVCSVNHDALEQSLTLVVGRLKNNANQVNAVAPTDILSLKCPDGEIGRRNGLVRLSTSRAIYYVNVVKFGERLTGNADANAEPSP